MSTLTVSNKTAYNQVLTQALALLPEEQSKLIMALAERLPPNIQVQLILQILPAVAPTMEAVLRNKTSSVIGGTTSEDARKLMDAWLSAPATEEDDPSWDEIMQALNAYQTTVIGS